MFWASVETQFQHICNANCLFFFFYNSNFALDNLLHVPLWHMRTKLIHLSVFIYLFSFRKMSKVLNSSYINYSAFFKKRQGYFNCYFLVFNIDSYFVKPNLKQCILFVKKVFIPMYNFNKTTNLLNYSWTTATFWLLF